MPRPVVFRRAHSFCFFPPTHSTRLEMRISDAIMNFSATRETWKFATSDRLHWMSDDGGRARRFLFKISCTITNFTNFRQLDAVQFVIRTFYTFELFFSPSRLFFSQSEEVFFSFVEKLIGCSQSIEPPGQFQRLRAQHDTFRPRTGVCRLDF